MTRTRIRSKPAACQQDVVDRWLADHPRGRRVIIAEGFGSFIAPDDVRVARLGGGCVCCIGQVPLRVTLTRLIRAERPEHLLLLLADVRHLPQVRTLLTDGSLGVRLELEDG